MISHLLQTRTYTILKYAAGTLAPGAVLVLHDMARTGVFPHPAAILGMAGIGALTLHAHRPGWNEPESPSEPAAATWKDGPDLPRFLYSTGEGIQPISSSTTVPPDPKASAPPVPLDQNPLK